MPEHISRVEAGRALDEVALRQGQIIAEIDVPAWYWWGLALGWIALGLVTVLGNPWLVLGATGIFGALHSSVATRVIDGRHRSRQLSVRADVVNRRIPQLVLGFLLVLVAATVAIALVADALGAPQPALIASVVIAVAVLLGGPQLMAVVRRRAERSARP
jgi:hypothetical protein